MDKANRDSLVIEGDKEVPINQKKAPQKNRNKKIYKSFKIYEYGENPRRYLIGIIYALLNVMMGMSSNPLTPIAVTVSKAYDLEIELVNLTSASYFFTTSIVAFPCIFVIRKIGLTPSIKLAAFLITLGFICRTMIRYNIYVVIGGQVLAGIAGPFFLTTQTRVVCQWFNEKDRGLWLTICSLAAPFGVLLGNFMLITLIDISGKSTQEDNKTQIYNCLLGEAAAGTFVCILTFLFWKNGATRGSILKMKKKKELKKLNGGMSVPLINEENAAKGNNSNSIKEQLKHIFSRRYLVLVSINYIVSFGVINASGSLLTEIIHAFEYEEKWGGISNITAILCGATSSLLFSCFIMKRRSQFKGMIFLVFTVAACQVASLFVYIKKFDPFYVVGLNALVGCAVFPIVPMTLEEMMSRLDPSHLITINAFLQAGNQIVAMGIIFAGGYIFDNPTIDKTKKFQIGIVIAYSSVFFLNFVIRCVGKVDAQRPSVVRRIRTKQNLVKGISEENESKKVETKSFKTDDFSGKGKNLLTNKKGSSDDDDTLKGEKIAKISNSDNYESLPSLSRQSSNNWTKEKKIGRSKDIKKITEEFIPEDELKRHKGSEEIFDTPFLHENNGESSN